MKIGANNTALLPKYANLRGAPHLRSIDTTRGWFKPTVPVYIYHVYDFLILLEQFQAERD